MHGLLRADVLARAWSTVLEPRFRPLREEDFLRHF